MKKLGAFILSIAFATPAMAEHDGWHVYLGADVVESTFAVSEPAVIFTGDNEGRFRETNSTDSAFNRIRFGLELSDSVAVEAHYGLEDDSADAQQGTVAVEEYYGLYLVPKAEFFDVINLTFPIGFSQVTVAGTQSSRDADGVAYGMNAELALSNFVEIERWDVALVAGGMVYQQDKDTRLYGYNFGLRVDYGF